MAQSHLLYRITDEEFKLLDGCKQHIEKNKYCKFDTTIPIKEIKRGGKISVELNVNGHAFNEIRLVMNFATDNTKLIELHELIKYVELLIGGMQHDKLSGYMLEILAKKYNRACVQTKRQIIMPILFDITSGENVVFRELHLRHYVHIGIEFGKANEMINVIDGNLIITEYKYPKRIELPYQLKNDKFIKPFISDPTTRCDFINLFKQVQFLECGCSEFGTSKYKLNFNHPATGIYFMLVHKDTGAVLKNESFPSYSLEINGVEVLTESFISVKQKSIENKCPNGVYWISLEHLNFNNNFEKYINFSTIYPITLCLDDLYIDTEEYNIHIYAMVYNFAVYAKDMFGELYVN